MTRRFTIPTIPANSIESLSLENVEGVRRTRACIQCSTAKSKCESMGTEMSIGIELSSCRRCRRLGQKCEYPKSIHRYLNPVPSRSEVPNYNPLATYSASKPSAEGEFGDRLLILEGMNFYSLS